MRYCSGLFEEFRTRNNKRMAEIALRNIFRLCTFTSCIIDILQRAPDIIPVCDLINVIYYQRSFAIGVP